MATIRKITAYLGWEDYPLPIFILFIISWGLVFLKTPGFVKFLLYSIFATFLLAIAVYDLKYKLVSPVVVILGLGLVIPLQMFLGKTAFTLKGLFGGLVISGLIYFLSWILGKITKLEYFGLGDVWVSLLIGSVLGLKEFIGVFIGAFYVQLIIGLTLYFTKRIQFHEGIPFVPMLAIAAGINGITKYTLVELGLRLIHKAAQ